MKKVKIGKKDGKIVSFNYAQALNRHVISIGESGSGKTTQCVHIINQLVKNGNTVLCIDAHNVLAETQIFPALKEDFSANLNAVDVYNNGITSPLFKPKKFSDGEVENILDTIDTITEEISATFKLGVSQKSMLRKSVKFVQEKNLYASRGISAISEVLDDMDNAKALEVSERISSLTNRNIFRDGDSFIKHKKINLLRISKFPFETQRIISEFVLNMLWQMAVHGEFLANEIFIFIDECQNMDLGKNGVLSKILVEGRKFGIHLLLSTQVLPSDKNFTKLMMQADFVMFFKPARNEVRSIARLIETSREEDWTLILRELKLGEFVACAPLLIDDSTVYSKPLKISALLCE